MDLEEPMNVETGADLSETASGTVEKMDEDGGAETESYEDGEPVSKLRKIESSKEDPKLIEEHDEAASRIPASSSEFFKLIHSPVYVDKSNVISVIMEPGQSSFLVTAPRRFGKSSVAQMLFTFLTIQVTDDGIPISKSLKELYHGKFNGGGRRIDKNNKIIPNRKSADELRMAPVKDTPYYDLFTNPIPGIYQQTGEKYCLNVSKNERMMTEHLGKYPVVYVELTADITNSYENVVQSVQSSISASYNQHGYLILSEKLLPGERKACKKWCDDEICHEMSEARTIVALKNLTRYLFKHFKQRCYVIVDEIDAIAMSCLSNVKDKEVFKNITDFITSMMDKLIKSNTYIRSGFLTGISQIVTADISKLNNVVSHRFLQSEPFFAYYGFTTDEVKGILSRFTLLKDRFADVANYYNGYCSDFNSKEVIFNTWSVVHYVKSTKLICHWSKSESVSQLDGMLHEPSVKIPLLSMLREDREHEIIFKRKLTSRDVRNLFEILNNNESNTRLEDSSLYFCFLYEQGHFKALIREDPPGSGFEKAKLSIPNREVKIVFEEYMVDYFCKKGLDLKKVEYCGELFNTINFYDETIAKATLEKVHLCVQDIFKVITVENEHEFHHVMFVILKRAMTFHCISEKTITNQTRPDLILYEKRNPEISGIVLELKFKKNREEALKVLVEKQYYKAFKTDDKKYILIGMTVHEGSEVTMSVLFNNCDLKQKIDFPST